MITVHFFAGLKRFFPSSIQLDIADGMTAEQVVAHLKEQYPKAVDLLSKCRIAIDEEFVASSTILTSDTELFLIPPSSGG